MKLSPEEFAKKMKLIDSDNCWEEDCHEAADMLMCDVLTSLGYGDGVRVFKDMPKIYD